MLAPCGEHDVLNPANDAGRRGVVGTSPATMGKARFAAAQVERLSPIHSLNTKQTVSVNEIRSISYEILTVKEF